MEITGRVTADAIVRTLSDARQVVNFSVAVSESYKAKNGERVTNTEFFDCSYWIGVGIAPHLTKGSIVELSGRVSVRAWIDGDGQAKAGLNFHTSKITLHGSSSPVAKQPSEQKAGSAVAPVGKMEVYGAEIVAGEPVPNDDLPF